MTRLSRMACLLLVALLVLGTPAIAQATPGEGHRSASKHSSSRKQAPPKRAATVRNPVVFNDAAPLAGKKDKYRILRRVLAAIRATSPTAQDPRPMIRIATFFLDWKPSVDALIGACRRGVGVQVVLDGKIKNGKAKRLAKRLNADNVRARGDRPAAGPCGSNLAPAPVRPVKPVAPQAPTAPRHPKHKTKKAKAAYAQALQYYRAQKRAYKWYRSVFLVQRQQYRKALRLWKRTMLARKQAARRYPVIGADRSFVMKCKGSCRGGRGNMHSKFYSFSHSGPVPKLVLISSSNLNKGGAVKGWNDLVAIWNHSKIYREFQTIHRLMAYQVPAPTKLVQVKEGPYTVRFFPLRKATLRNDPVMHDLSKIRCHSAYGRTRVHVSMFLWGGDRGKAIARRLAQLGRAGCDVRVVFGATRRAVRLQLRKYAVRRVIRLYDSRRDVNPAAPGYEVRTHGKFVLVKGTFAGNRKAHVVMTGTANWVYGSLRLSDEVTVNVARASTWRKYLNGWRAVRRHSTVVPRYFAY